MVGSTGRWPQVVNLWEYQSWESLARNFETELVGGGLQDPELAGWWAEAAWNAALARLPDASVPWALAVNGCASVGAAALFPLLATTMSMHAAIAFGAVLYVLLAAMGGRVKPSP